MIKDKKLKKGKKGKKSGNSDDPGAELTDDSTVKADMNEEYDDSSDQMLESLCSLVDNLQKQVYAAWDKHYQHTDPSKHLPPFSGAGQLNKALKSLGMDEDYSIQKKTIFCSKNGSILEVEYKKSESIK